MMPARWALFAPAALEHARALRYQSFMGRGATASSGLVDTAGGSSWVALFGPDTGASSAAGDSSASTGAAASADALAEPLIADSAGLFASGVWVDMGAAPPSGTLLASTAAGVSDAGPTSGAALFNSTDSRGSSGGRGRGNGGKDTVRRWCALGLRSPSRNFCAIPDDGPFGGWIDGHSA